MKNTSNYYTVDVAKKREYYFESKRNSNNSTKILIDTVINSLNNTSFQRILDLGTGNGFVAKTLSDKATDLKLNIDIYAIDLSDEMLEQAKKICNSAKNIIIKKRDNNATGFDNNYFDVVVAKNVTAFSPEEIYRILKPGGKLVMKEYGRGKGLLEITSLFPNRISSNSAEEIIDDFRSRPWKHIQYTQYLFTAQMTKKDIRETLAIAPIINHFSWDADHETIDTLFSQNKTIAVTSDPWILYAEK